MDKHFQDMTIMDKHFNIKTERLVIPRGSTIKTILFLSDNIYIHYIHNGFLQVAIIGYDQLENGKKIIID